VVATGSYDAPHVPDIKGLVDWSKAKEGSDFSVYHSRTYRRPERYAGKTVLVIGVGTSGSEIARDIGPHVKNLYASIRPHETYHAFERRSLRRFPSTTKFIPEIVSFTSLPSDDEGIQHGKIVLKNGTVLTGIDEIILATGYRRSNAFLGALRERIIPSKDTPKPAPSPDAPDVFGGNELRSLHWTGHYIPDPTLAFSNIRPWTLGRYQSLALAKVWQGTARLPTEKEMWEQYNDTSGRWNRFRGLFGTIPSEAIHRQYVVWLNNESLELGGQLVEPWPVQNREAFSYYANQLWEAGYISRDNFTRFDNLPADEWSTRDVWDAMAYDDESW